MALDPAARGDHHGRMEWPSWTPYALVGAFVLVNLWAFALCWWDKRAARLARPRVPEKSLVAPVFLGGPFGLLAGMRRFRHKTVKRSFQVKLGAATLVWFLWVAGVGWVAWGAS